MWLRFSHVVCDFLPAASWTVDFPLWNLQRRNFESKSQQQSYFIWLENRFARWKLRNMSSCEQSEIGHSQLAGPGQLWRPHTGGGSHKCRLARYFAASLRSTTQTFVFQASAHNSSASNATLDIVMIDSPLSAALHSDEPPTTTRPPNSSGTGVPTGHHAVGSLVSSRPLEASNQTADV